jgi:hypothetical protein
LAIRLAAFMAAIFLSFTDILGLTPSDLRRSLRGTFAYRTPIRIAMTLRILLCGRKLGTTASGMGVT